VSFQPGGECRRSAVGEHVNWLVALQVNKQRAIGMALAKGEVIDTKHARGWVVE
jgi:hypothetical protein